MAPHPAEEDQAKPNNADASVNVQGLNEMAHLPTPTPGLHDCRILLVGFLKS